MVYPVFFLISFVASTIGAIAGIGGGVIIKPVLDAFHLMSVASISFLSGCTVLSMSGYSVIRGHLSGDACQATQAAVSLGIGAAVGGILGKRLFEALNQMVARPSLVGTVQSACLLFITVVTFLYTLYTDKVKACNVRNPILTAIIGLIMGIISAFLGIGGGPVNLMVLSYFFSMDVKTSAQSSLIVILLSQIASLLNTLIVGSVPDFPPFVLILMVGGGLLGGILGRNLNERMSEFQVRTLYLCAMAAIILLCFRNMIAYLH